MRYLLRIVVFAWTLLAFGSVFGQSFTAEFSGPALLTNYQALDKPEKFKEYMTFNLVDNGTCTVDLRENQSQLTGNWYVEGQFIYLKLESGAGYLSGRLLLKGKPGAYKGMSGILSHSFNGYSGMFEYKVRVKGEVL